MSQNDPPVLLTTWFLHCADTFPRVPGGASEYFDINLSLGSLVLLEQGGHVLWLTKSIHACSLSLESRWGFQFATVNPLLLQKLYNAPERKGFSGGTTGKESICQCRRRKWHRFHLWVGKIPWRRAWQPTPVFLPGESHGRKNLVGYSPWGCKQSDTTKEMHTHC